jgi:hypothetical protein
VKKDSFGSLATAVSGCLRLPGNSLKSEKVRVWFHFDMDDTTTYSTPMITFPQTKNNTLPYVIPAVQIAQKMASPSVRAGESKELCTAN